MSQEINGMIDDAIKAEMELIRRQINIEESVDYRVDRRYVRELWDKYHRLNELLKINDKEGTNS